MMTTAALITMVIVQLTVTVVTAVFIAKVLRKNKSGAQQKDSEQPNTKL